MVRIDRFVAAGLLLTDTQAGAAAPALGFDAVFTTAHEPRQLRYRALYRNGTGIHRLAVWRQGQRRLKRVTDDRVTTLVDHRPGAADFTMRVVDRRTLVTTRLDRSSLYRVGNFTNWFDLAHGLRRPAGTYRLTRGSTPRAMPPVPDTCTWYVLTQPGGTTSICWNRDSALPFLIVDGSGRLVWRVTGVDGAPFGAAAFAADDAGYAHVDAVSDIGGD